MNFFILFGFLLLVAIFSQVYLLIEDGIEDVMELIMVTVYIGLSIIILRIIISCFI